MTRAECECLLARNRVGRIAFARGNRIEIIPLHFVFADGVLCGRTAHDTRLEKTSRNLSNAWPAAFEVDEVDGLFDWRSVVVHGNLHAASPGDDEWRRDRALWERTARALRTILPEAFTEADPTAFRQVLIRVDVSEISGREAVSVPVRLAPRVRPRATPPQRAAHRA
jgi:nitroimidazol reductase NimA-like FMN-containing flavoprotein (pyridoxamine 5'-phosphate oxidase superfamily)